MDLAARKYKFIEEFTKLTNLKKIKRLEHIMHDEMNSDEIVAYTVKGTPLTQEEYVALNDKAEAEYHKGNFVSHKQIKEKFKARRDL